MLVYTPLITVENFIRMVERGEVEVAPFQRLLTWSDKEMAEYVKGVLEGLAPLSTIIVGRVGGRSYIVDGLNRTTALSKFYRGELTTSVEGRRMKFGELPPDLRQRFLSAQLLVTFVEADKEEDLRKIFTIVNKRPRQLTYADWLYAQHYDKPAVQLARRLAEAIAQRCRPKCRPHPFLVATALLYWYVTRNFVKEYRAMENFVKEADRLDMERLRKAVEEALARIHQIDIKDLRGSFERVFGITQVSKRPWINVAVEEAARGKAPERAIIEALLGRCVGNMCSVYLMDLKEAAKAMAEAGLVADPARLLRRLKKALDRCRRIKRPKGTRIDCDVEALRRVLEEL